MASLEKKRLVLRVAYAGAPLAGKTESIRALLRLLRGKGGDKYVFSPGEARGRTVFFDWADYEAGTFQGNPIRCQITSVPGQSVLSSRREALLKAADAVILVVDSRPEGWEEARRCYREMAPWLAEAGRDVAVRVILQCNKQDLDGSLAPEQLAEKLGLPAGSRSHGTSARTGKGLRPAFIAAVRDALERAEALIERGLIRFGQPEINSGQELLERLQRDVFASDEVPSQQEPSLAPAMVVPTPPPPAFAVSAPEAPPSEIARATAVPRSSRPAVMPASAWREARSPDVSASTVAAVPVTTSEVELVAAPVKIEPPREQAPEHATIAAPAIVRIEMRNRVDSDVRPAVMPASAYREAATTRFRSLKPLFESPPSASRPDDDASQIDVASELSWTPDALEPTVPEAKIAAPQPIPAAPKATAGRPAVMPATAFRAQFGVDAWRTVPSLAARLHDWPRAGDSPEAMAQALVDSAAGYLNAFETLRPPEALPLEDALRKKLSIAPRPLMDVPALLSELQKKAAGRLPGSVLEMMCSVLIGH